MKQTFIRRCHVCGTLCESVGEPVKECQSCGKHLAPFFFFDESELEGIGEASFLMSLRPLAEGYQPLWGFSAMWAEDS